MLHIVLIAPPPGMAGMRLIIIISASLSLVLSELMSLQISYQPSEFDYQYHLPEGCAVDCKVFPSK